MADIQNLLKQLMTAVYGKDVRQTIVDCIKQCYTDNSEGLIPIVTTKRVEQGVEITITVGTVVEKFVLVDGYIPVKGKDYWTDEDLEKINVDISSMVVDECSKYEQLKPEFAQTIKDCTDISKMYVLPDGYIYAYMYKEKFLPAYTNLLNAGECETGVRLSSSGGTSAIAGYFVTPYIPIGSKSKGKLLRWRNATKMVNNAFFVMYDSSKNPLGASYSGGAKQGTDENGDGYITLGYGYSSAGESEYDESSIAYIRLCFAIPSNGIENVIITIDEPIVDGAMVKDYQWENTGHAFVPTNYEDRILALEKIIANGATIHGVVDENVITLTGALADGIYTLKFENEDEIVSEIVTVSIRDGRVV